MHESWSLCLLVLSLCNVFGDTDAPNPSDMDDFDDNHMEGYRSHSDLKWKWQFMNIDSLPIAQAPFAKPQLSPSKVFYKIPMQQSTSILLSLRNLGESAFNITSITGYIHAAHRFSFYVQNNTARFVDVVLAPSSEISLEYRFIPWPGLPAVDYVFSGDIEYDLVMKTESETQGPSRGVLPSVEYKHKFMNVTINIYDPAPMNWIDFQLLFMSISITIFWIFVAVLFHELWWIPNQEAQGKQPLSTQDWLLSIYEMYLKTTYYKVREKVLNEPNPMNNVPSHKTNSNTSGNNVAPKKSSNNDWLTGTSASSKKKKRKKN
eukprot:216793_1